MVREALDYIRRNYIKDIVVKHPDRAESTRRENFPYEAIEEAVVNAIYHRSYEEREPVEVRISPDELAILSFPGPDRSIAMKDLRRGKAVSRRYRNRRIGEFLKELDLTEGRSTGIPKILRAMRANGSPLPIFETDEDRLSLLVRLRVHPNAPATPHVTTQDNTQDATQDRSITNRRLRDLEIVFTASNTQVTPQVETLVGKILKAASKAQSRDALQEVAGMMNREYFRKAYLKPLIQAGWLELTLPDKPSSKRQQYRLTDAGRAWLELS